jgi:hypothetical protein
MRVKVTLTIDVDAVHLVSNSRYEELLDASIHNAEIVAGIRKRTGRDMEAATKLVTELEQSKAFAHFLWVKTFNAWLQKKKLGKYAKISA